MRTAAEHGQKLQVLEAVRNVNEAQKHVLVDKIARRFGKDLAGSTFAVWGLSFKPSTDDMREAPSRVTIKAVLERGAAVVAYDPAAMDEARRVPPIDLQEHPGQPERLRFAETLFFDYHRQHAVDIRVARIFNN